MGLRHQFKIDILLAIVVYLVLLIGLVGLISRVAESATCTPCGRFDWAQVPELALVRGLPQTVQLGIYQLDPANPWPAGDLTRLGGWT